MMSEIQLETLRTRRRRRSRVVVTLVLMVLLLGLGAWWIGWADALEGPGDEDGEIVTLEPLTTTVGQRGIHHARVGVAIVLAEGVDPGVVTPRTALLQDALLREVAAMDADSVRSTDGSDQLRERLTERAQSIWSEDLIRRVVLTELLVQ